MSGASGKITFDIPGVERIRADLIQLAAAMTMSKDIQKLNEMTVHSSGMTHKKLKLINEQLEQIAEYTLQMVNNTITFLSTTLGIIESTDEAVAHRISEIEMERAQRRERREQFIEQIKDGIREGISSMGKDS